MHGNWHPDAATATAFTGSARGWAELVGVLAASALGVWGFGRLGMANPSVLGALAVAAALSASGTVHGLLPKPVTAAAQVALALTLAVRFTPASVRAAPRWLGAVALGTVGMIGAGAVFAAGLGWLTGQQPATLLLATAPGGIAEMSITAAALGLAVPVVTAFHVLRYVAVSVGTGPMWRAESRRLARQAAAAAAAATADQSGSR